MKTLAAAFVLWILAHAGTAAAGECDRASAVAVLKDIEKYAKDPRGKAPEVWGLCMDQQIMIEPALTQRFLAACEQILARDKKFGVCVQWPIRGGKARLGAIELFDLVEEAFTMDPLGWESPPILLYIKLDDPRALPRVIAGWKATIGNKKTARPPYENAWVRFRSGAAKFLGKHGGATEKAFLEEQLPLTKDAGVKKSIRAALKAIDARTGGPASP